MAFRRNNRQSKAQATVSEEFRIHTENELRNFASNENMISYEFPSTLNNAERAWIHNYIKNFSYVSRSHGKEPNRRLTVTKKKDLTNKDVATITLDRESQQIIQAFLCKYPHITERRDTHQLQLHHHQNNEMDTNMGQLTCGIPQHPVFGLNSDLITFRTSLPIWPMREDIIKQIISNQVVIIKGETGSGKTTQIPQFILDYSVSTNEKCRIICTQPRRISAISVAERVAHERGEIAGQTVGYHIRLESCVSPLTSLIYCTNGILLRTLMNGDSCLNSMTHIIVDEIHERDRFSDFLLITLRECLVNYPNVRLILMSATIDITTFKDYFNNAPVIFIPGRLHNVQNYYLDDILMLLQYESPAMKALKGSLPPENLLYTEPILQTNSALLSEMDDCILDCFSNGTDDAFNLFFQFILNDHFPINYQHSVTGYTALMAAAFHGNMDICMQLLQYGANIRLRSTHEKLAAPAWAFMRQHGDIYEVLTQMESYAIDNIPDPSFGMKDDIKKKLDLYHKTVSDQTIDYDLLLALIQFVHSSSGPGSILVFLAGYEEIVTLKDRILSDSKFQTPFEIFVLHGMMQNSDQHKVFNTLLGQRKIILSTNIAETSITIDDVVYVIDSGKVKELAYDALTGISSLQLGWISQSAAKQRAGRAGRTRTGICYHVFSNNRYKSMQKFSTPEMLRMPLHELCLQTKMLAPEETKIADFLCRAIERPSCLAVKNAIKHLQEIGALNEDESLTVLGQHLVDFPVEPCLAKMLIYSVIFKCIDPVLTIVSFLNHRDPFVLPNTPQQKQIAMNIRKQFSSNSFSDQLILLKVFQAWQNARLASSERLFCTQNNINAATMETIVKIRSQLLAQLRASGFVSTKPPGDIRELNENSNNWATVKAVLTAGLYPNIAYVDKDSLKIRTRTEKKISLHMSSCVRTNNNNDGTYLRNLPTNWLIFEELSRTNTHHNIRSVTCITPLTVALFSDDIDSYESEEADSDDESTFANKWVVLNGNPNILTMIAQLRAKLQALILKKVSNPHKVFSFYDCNLLNTIISVLQREDLVVGFEEPIGIGQRPKIMNCTNGVAHEESFKNRMKARILNTANQELCFRYLNFKPVNIQHYNRFTPEVLYVPVEEEIEQQENTEAPIDQCLERFEDFSLQNNAVVPYEEQNSLMNFDFNLRSNEPYLDEACAVEPVYGPIWIEHINNPEWTLFSLIKIATDCSIDFSIIKKSWTFPPYVEKKVKILYETGKNVILIFSTHNNRTFQGIARLVKMPDIQDEHYSIACSLEWISKTKIPFSAVQAFYPEQYDDGDQLQHALGVRLFHLFTNAAPPSIQQIEPMCPRTGRAITKRQS